MMWVKQRPLCARALQLIELAGPAGSGKSTIMGQFRNQNHDYFGYVGRPKPRFMHRLWAALIASRSLFFPLSLELKERRRLFQAHRTLIGARLWISELPNGIHLLDEGPFRIMRDFACFSEQQLTRWRRIVRTEVCLLDGTDVLIVLIQSSAQQRDDRRRERMSPLEENDPKFNPALGPVKSRRLFYLSSEWDSIICDMRKRPKYFELDNTGSILSTVQNLFSELKIHIAKQPLVKE